MVPNSPHGDGLGGLTHSTVRDVLPRTVNITIAAQPSGPQLTLDDQPITGTHTVAAVVGMVRTIGAPSPQGIRNWNYTFVSGPTGGRNARHYGPGH